MISMIYAQTPERVIAAGGVMPWHVPEDLAYFRRMTTGKTLLMGRTTWEALEPAFRPLPGRRNIVLTRNAEYVADGAEVAHTLEDGLRADGNVWVIGGGQLYAAALPYAARVFVTEIETTAPGDTLAPELPAGEVRYGPWEVSSSGLRYRFGIWENPATLAV
ncbi:MAG: dihydrofolate reductase [Ruaniaceae bacterium]|nr:dihydrofolate reductase [Ruaniaceae bacterium]